MTTIFMANPRVGSYVSVICRDPWTKRVQQWPTPSPTDLGARLVLDVCVGVSRWIGRCCALRLRDGRSQPSWTSIASPSWWSTVERSSLSCPP